MRSKWLWILISCLVAAALVLASCGPAEEEEEEEVAEEEVPQYGGTLRLLHSADPRTFDDAFSSNQGCYTLQLTQEELWQGDWSKGPAGTGEVTWAVPGVEAYPAKYSAGVLAESWDMDEDTATLTFYIRKGIHWHNKPPTNGRELVADDVAFSLSRAWDTGTSILGRLTKPPVSIEASDKYTVVIKYASYWEMISGIREVTDFQSIWPRDALEANNNDMRDWNLSIGTGPFILKEYVQGSSVTLERNLDYWDKDPCGLGIGNQLPYLDEVRILIIPDVSTQMSAIRTAKVDRVTNISRENAESLKMTNPKLLWNKALGISTSGPYFIAFRLDIPDKPWNDIKVRQALHMAVDYQAIADSYYDGDAEVYSFPAPANIESSDFFTPLDQLPKSVQELFEYNPEKAKTLLDEAGFGNGFTVNVLCKIEEVDLLSIYKDYWNKIGVTLEIDPREYAVYMSARRGAAWDDAVFTWVSMNMPIAMEDFRIGRNLSYVSDPRIEQAREDVWEDFFDWPKRCQTFKEITPHLLELCWYIPSPTFYVYTAWEPWLKNYHGEESNGNNNMFSWARWVWVDQDLKEKMTETK